MIQRKSAEFLVVLLLVNALCVSSYFPRVSASTDASQPFHTIAYRLFTTNGIFELTFANGTTQALLFGAGTLANVNLTQSLLSSTQGGFDVGLSTSYDPFYVSPAVGNAPPAHSVSVNAHVVRVSFPSMEIFSGNVSLGYYYLWLPHQYPNDSSIANYLTIQDIHGVRHDYPGHLIEKSGFDYITVVNQNPLVSVVNIYNASSGEPVSLMIPGESGFSVSQVESGNFTLGFTDLGYTPLGILLNYNWFDFYTVAPHGFFVATNYLSHLQSYLNFVSEHGFDLTSQSTTESTTVVGYPVGTVVLVVGVPLIFLVIIAVLLVRRKRFGSRTWKESEDSGRKQVTQPLISARQLAYGVGSAKLGRIRGGRCPTSSLK